MTDKKQTEEAIAGWSKLSEFLSLVQKKAEINEMILGSPSLEFVYGYHEETRELVLIVKDKRPEEKENGL